MHRIQEQLRCYLLREACLRTTYIRVDISIIYTVGSDNTGGVVGNTDLSTCCEVLIRGLVYISLMVLRLPLSSDSVPW